MTSNEARRPTQPIEPGLTDRQSRSHGSKRPTAFPVYVSIVIVPFNDVGLPYFFRGGLLGGQSNCWCSEMAVQDGL